MRIAIWHNLPSGGGSRALFDHVRGLLARGHTLEAWCPPTADRSFAPLGSLIPEHVVPLDMPQPTRLTDKLQLTLKVARELAAMEAHCRTCAAAIDRGGFDLLFANSCQFFRMTPVARFTRLPSVLYLQEPYRWLYEALPELRWLAPPAQAHLDLARLRRWFTSWREVRNGRVQARHEVDDAAAYARILVNSRFSRESVIRAYGVDAAVCYLGIDTAWFHDRGAPREPFVIGLGSVTPEKGIDLAVASVAAMPPPRPRLVWVGNMALPDYRREMDALAAARGVQLDLQVGLDAATVLDLLNRASAMVYAPRLEPFGLAPLEANACGLPVVAVAEGGVRETVEDGANGLLVDRDPGAVAAALARILGDAALAARLRREGRRLVEARWGLEQATDRLEHALTTVAQAAAALPAGAPSAP